jgi:HAD superfamily hydrolase (TIGR01509 family)
MRWEWFSRTCVGIADTELFDTIASLGVGVSGEEVRAVYPAKTALYRAAMVESPPFAPGIAGLLEDLTAAGLPHGLVTSSMREEVEPILAVGGLNFKPRIFRDDVEFRKPHPEPYLRGAALMGVERILAVEDSDHGVNSARAAGLSVLQIRRPEELNVLVRIALECELT